METEHCQFSFHLRCSHAEDKGVWNRTHIQHFLWQDHDAFLCYCTKGWLVLHGSPLLRPWPRDIALRSPALGRHLEKGGNITMAPGNLCNTHHIYVCSFHLQCFKVSYKQNLKPTSLLYMFAGAMKNFSSLLMQHVQQ